MFLRIIFIVALLMSAAAGWHVYGAHRDIKIMATPSIDTVLGNPAGKFTIVEFMDYRCPGCRHLNPSIERLLGEYPDIRLVIRHVPVHLDSSIRDCRLALAAAMQGKFKEIHNRLIAREEGVSEDEIDALASEIGIDAARLKQDMNGPEVASLMLETLNTTNRYGFRTIPSFLIDGVHYSNAPGAKEVPSYEVLAAAIQSHLGQKK